MPKQYVIDIESNNLYPYQTDTWTICIKRVGTNLSTTIHPYRIGPEATKQAILEYIFGEEGQQLDEPPTIIGHNFLGFDGWVLWKDFGLNLRVGGKRESMAGHPCKFFDTLFASQFLYPDREGKHSLESWGERLKFKKIDYRQIALSKGIITEEESEFCRWSLDMDLYCLQDCNLTERVFVQLDRQITEEGVWEAFKLGQKNFFLMEAQGFTGFKFDSDRAVKLKPRIEEMIVNLRNEVEPDLPPRKLKKAEEAIYQMPAKPFKKDGEISAVMERFLENHNGKALFGGKIKVFGKTMKIEPHKLIIDSLPMTLDDGKELKDYFMNDLKWVPTMWNYKLGLDKKPMKDRRGQKIKTSPKIQENHVICPNLLELDGELPKKITNFLSLKNRLSILEGWLANPRLEWDGRLTAGSTGLAACFTADTLILTDNGMRNWFQISKGDLVVTHKNNLKPVTDVFVNGLKEVFEVTLENGIKTKLTANHPLYTDKNEFVKVEDLQVGDYVMAYHNKEIWGQWKGTEIMVSSWGRVKNLWTNNYATPRKELRAKRLVVDLRFSSEGRSGRRRAPKVVSRLVIETFKEMKKGSHCLHLNDLAFDNNVENLMWGDNIINAEHRKNYSTAISAARNRKNTKLDWDKVKYIRTSNLNNIELSKMFNVCDSTISQIRNYIRWAKHEDEYQEKKLSIIPVRVVSVIPVGKQMTYGISVQDDESHLTDGIMSHNTHRQKHTTVVNVPRAGDDAILGNEFRELFTVEKGFKLVGCDQAALEARCEGHWTYRYDNGESANELIFGDLHSRNSKVFFPEETLNFDINSPDFNKDDPGFKKYRSLSKNGKYALTFGCSPKKLATTLRKPETDGQRLYDIFWEANPGLKKLRDKVEFFWERRANSKWIPGIDGRRLYSRSKHSLINLLIQSTGAIIVDYSVCLFDMKMGGQFELDDKGRPYYIYKDKIVKRVAYQHDEFITEAEEEIAEEIGTIMEWCMEEAGRRLKLNIPLKGQAKIGGDWRETH